jgi:DNA repair exonuclease SbcCD nuclease subunit
MKILFSADWHIKLGQKNVPKEWQKARYTQLFNLIDNIACDVHIVGGDVFDNLPSMEELAMYFEFITTTKHKTIIFPGNHEASKKGQTFFENLSTITNAVSSSNISVCTSVTDYDGFQIIPYNKLGVINSAKPTAKLLFTHVRGEIAPHVKPEIDLDLLNKWQLVLAGDLHSHANSQRNIVYPGSPLSTSFHRSKIKNGVVLLDSDTLAWEFIELNLPQLIRKTVTDEKDIVKTEYDHTIYELKGNVLDLAKTDTSNTLLDKKIVNKSTKPRLEFSGVSSIGEELSLYLRKAKNLDNTTADEVVKVFYDYNK